MRNLWPSQRQKYFSPLSSSKIVNTHWHVVKVKKSQSVCLCFLKAPSRWTVKTNLQWKQRKLSSAGWRDDGGSNTGKNWWEPALMYNKATTTSATAAAADAHKSKIHITSSSDANIKHRHHQKIICAHLSDLIKDSQWGGNVKEKINLKKKKRKKCMIVHFSGALLSLPASESSNVCLRNPWPIHTVLLW